MTHASDKIAVRREALLRRAGVSNTVRQQFADSLARDGMAYVERHPICAFMALYLPIRGEPDPLPLIDALVAAERITALPVAPAPGNPLLFRHWQRGDRLVRGRYDIAEPDGSAREVVPDILFVPLAAFDARGYRLGYGGGYYDATLAALRAAGPVHAVGVGYSVQEVAAVPTEPHDERLDAIITERGLITFAADP